MPTASSSSTAATSTTSVSRTSAAANATAAHGRNVAVLPATHGIARALQKVANLTHGTIEAITQCIVRENGVLGCFQLSGLNSSEQEPNLIMLGERVDFLSGALGVLGKGGLGVVTDKVAVHIIIKSEITTMSVISQASDCLVVRLVPMKNNIYAK